MVVVVVHILVIWVVTLVFQLYTCSSEQDAVFLMTILCCPDQFLPPLLLAWIGLTTCLAACLYELPTSSPYCCYL